MSIEIRGLLSSDCRMFLIGGIAGRHKFEVRGIILHQHSPNRKYRVVWLVRTRARGHVHSPWAAYLWFLIPGNLSIWLHFVFASMSLSFHFGVGLTPISLRSQFVSLRFDVNIVACVTFRFTSITLHVHVSALQVHSAKALLCHCDCPLISLHSIVHLFSDYTSTSL